MKSWIVLVSCSSHNDGLIGLKPARCKELAARTGFVNPLSRRDAADGRFKANHSGGGQEAVGFGARRQRMHPYAILRASRPQPLGPPSTRHYGWNRALGSFCLSCALIGAPSVAVAAAQPTIATAKPVSGSGTVAAAVPAAATPAPTAQATVQSAAAAAAVKAATAAPTTGSATAATSQPAQPPETLTSEIMSFAPLALMLIVVFFFMSSGRKREQKKRDQMHNALKRGSRVVTAGGLIASVVEVRDDEVVLKVDEANNIKERYTKSAIIKVLDEGDAAPDKI